MIPIRLVLTSGIGALLGSLLAGELSRHFPEEYPLVFLIPCLINLGLLVWFWAGFRPDPDLATAEWTDAALPAATNLAPEPAEG